MLDNMLKQELKTKLEEEKRRIEDELRKFAKRTENPENYETQYQNIGPSKDENATEVEEYVDDLALEQNLEHQLREINDALEKMEKGTYGFCENCKQEIDTERLKAYPAAKTCIKCGGK